MSACCLEKYAGQYEVPFINMIITIEVNEGKLQASIPHQPAQELTHKEGSTFELKGMNLSLEFTMDENGVVNGANIPHPAVGIVPAKKIA